MKVPVDDQNLSVAQTPLQVAGRNRHIVEQAKTYHLAGIVRMMAGWTYQYKTVSHLARVNRIASRQRAANARSRIAVDHGAVFVANASDVRRRMH